MGVWAGPGWPEAGLRTKPPSSPYLGLGRRRPAGSRPSPTVTSPGWGSQRTPSPPANCAPSGQWAPSPASRRADTKGEESSRRGAKRPESEGGEGREDARRTRRTREPAGLSGAVQGAAPPRRRRRESGLAVPSTAQQRREESATHKEERDSHHPTAQKRDRLTRSGCRRSAAPASPRLQGAGEPCGAPLFRTHPQLRAPAHGGT